MLIKTKNYKLPTGVYVKAAMMSLLKKEWWYAAAPIAIGCGFLWIPTHWWITGAITLAVGYLAFWWIQFKGLTQMEQGKMLFEKMAYEITSQQILMKISSKQGMPVKWDQIKYARMTKDAFVLNLSKAQIIYLPFRIMANENQVKFIKSILSKKKIL